MFVYVVSVAVIIKDNTLVQYNLLFISQKNANIIISLKLFYTVCVYVCTLGKRLCIVRPSQLSEDMSSMNNMILLYFLSMITQEEFVAILHGNLQQ